MYPAEIWTAFVDGVSGGPALFRGFTDENEAPVRLRCEEGTGDGGDAGKRSPKRCALLNRPRSCPSTRLRSRLIQRPLPRRPQESASSYSSAAGALLDFSAAGSGGMNFTFRRPMRPTTGQDFDLTGGIIHLIWSTHVFPPTCTSFLAGSASLCTAISNMFKHSDQNKGSVSLVRAPSPSPLSLHIPITLPEGENITYMLLCSDPPSLQTHLSLQDLYCKSGGNCIVEEENFQTWGPPLPRQPAATALKESLASLALRQ